jgi:UDP-N-acetylmuramate dehydrogenase
MDNAELCGMLGPEARCNEPMSEHTTLRIGGPADVYVPVYSMVELVGAVRVARMAGRPHLLLGEGANLLVADAGIRAVVIENRTQHVIVRCQADGIVVLAESGTPLADLARYCTRRGIAGLEWAVDVPGTMGGSVVGNAGAYGGRMSDIVREASVLTRDNEIVRMSADELGFGYRTSKLKAESARRQDRAVLLSVEMLLHWGTQAALEEQAAQYTTRRWEKQPAEPSAGSIFKRTASHPAGYLIEQAGLKGLRLGQAQISPRHANVIVNLGGASAEDVRTLMETARLTVRERFGQALEPEIELAGEFAPRPTTLPPWKPA